MAGWRGGEPHSLLNILSKVCFSVDFSTDDKPDKNLAISDYGSVNTGRKILFQKVLK